MAQSIFQIGGNVGRAFGPIAVALIVIPHGQGSIRCFALFAVVAIWVLAKRYGRKYVIWVSILGSSPFALLLPYCDLPWTIILVILVGMVMSSAMSAILVYGTELLPGNVGMISGAFFGLSFGLGGIGSAIFGWLADMTSIQYVFQLTAFLPLLGIVTYLLPNIKEKN